MQRLILLTILVGLIGIAPALAQGTRTPAEICADATPVDDPDRREFDEADSVLEDDIDYQAVFCTDVGPIHVELFEEETPITVNSFVFLAEAGFYNNSIFHRVLPNFMAQGGDPVGDPAGTGGPGYRFEDEFVASLTFDDPGKLAMANSGPGTNGSQFFITTAPTPHLQDRHTIFGEVITGNFVVSSIQLRDPSSQPASAPATTLETVVIITEPESVEIVDFTPEPATRAEIEDTVMALPDTMPETMDSLAQGLSDFLETAADATQIMTRAQRAAFAGDAEGDFADYLDSHGHEFSAASAVDNINCDLDILPMATINYVIDVFPTPEDAQAAFDDAALEELQIAQGFEVADAGMEYPVFISTASGCDDENLILARGFQQRGRFITRAEVAFVEGVVTEDNEESAGLILEEFAYIIFDAALADILRPELAR